MAGLAAAFAGLSLLIVLAGVVLARASDHLADHTPLGRSLAGVVLLAGATSLPEMAVGWSAVSLGAVDLAVGEMLGSCLINLLILAVVDLLTRSRGGVLNVTAAAHALSATLCVAMAATLLLGLELGPSWTVLRLGMTSWALLGMYLLGVRLISLDQQVSVAKTSTPPEGRSRVGAATLAYLLAAGVILLTAPQLAHVADQLALKSGLGETFFGTTFVALATSLPELATSAAAIRIGAVDLAVGNVFGSNCINLAIIAVVDAASPLSILDSASPVHVVTTACVILTTAVTTLSLLYHAERRWLLVEPDALLVILLVLGSLWLVYAQ